MKPRIVSIGNNNFNLIKELGKGAYGSVYLTEINGVQKAIKIIINTKAEGTEPLREIDIMSRLSHLNLIHAEGLSISVANVVTVGIVMPLATTDLHRIIRDPKFTFPERLKILCEILEGIRFLHESNYLHLDLKPENILIFSSETGEKNAKLADFGLSLLISSDQKYYPSELITINYQPPEVIDGNRFYSKASDVWSLGIIMLELLSYGRTLHTNFRKDIVREINEKFLSAGMIDNTLNSFLIPNNYREIIKQMLNFDPLKRPSVAHIINVLNIQQVIGTIIYNKPLPPKVCDLIYYYGFDYMVRMALKFPIKTETFFLAADIYQRSLTFIKENDWTNTVAVATTSMYMAIKMLEPYYVELDKLVKMASNVFNVDNVLTIEAAIVELFDGKLYLNNLFTSSQCLNDLVLKFDLTRNCYINSTLDFIRINNNVSDKKNEKDILFNNFIVLTSYYKYLEDRTQSYLMELFLLDKN